MYLEDVRTEIDEVDRQITTLLNRRAQLALDIGKRKAGEAAEVYDPGREADVLANVVGSGSGPLSDKALRLIYSEVLSACRALQRELRVGYLGPEATFTHEAALRHFGASATLVPCRTIEDVFREARRGSVEYGVVPVENSTAGAVTSTLDVFVNSDLQICAEIELPISHFLLSRSPLGSVERVYSHPMALAQCQRWLSEHLERVECVEVASTALAAQMAAESANTAAIGPEAAAKTYDLAVIAPRIEDSPDNVTRFLVIGTHSGQRGNRNKTAMIFSVRHQAGALHGALGMLAEHGINLTRIESRPSRQGLWEYVFFVDFLGHPEDESVAKALDCLRQHCSFVKILGAWSIDCS